MGACLFIASTLFFTRTLLQIFFNLNVIAINISFLNMFFMFSFLNDFKKVFE